MFTTSILIKGEKKTVQFLKKSRNVCLSEKKIAHVLKIHFKGMQTSDVLHPEDEHLHLLSPSPSYRQSDSQRCRATERWPWHPPQMEFWKNPAAGVSAWKHQKWRRKSWRNGGFFIWKTSSEIRRFLVKDHVTIDSINLDLEDESDKWITPPETNMSPKKGGLFKRKG